MTKEALDRLVAFAKRRALRGWRRHLRLTRRRVLVLSTRLFLREKLHRASDGTAKFFVLGMGRSGTTFLAKLLNQSGGACVYHEPSWREDSIAYEEAFHSEKKALNYILSFRRYDIALRIARNDCEHYGEVNPFLRRHCTVLQKVFQDASLLHLVRDGRDVVRSMMTRGTMNAHDLNTQQIRPPQDDPYSTSWSEMSRFERLCWYWQASNRYLRRHISSSVTLEGINASYDYFKSRVLNPLGVSIGKHTWRKYRKKKLNRSTTHTFPQWEDWSSLRQERFRDICGEEMARYSFGREY